MLRSAWMKMNHVKVWWIGLFALLVLVLALPPMSRAAEESSSITLTSEPIQVLVSDAERVQFAVLPPEMKRGSVILDGDQYDRLIIDGYEQSAVAGQPQLPEKAVVVALPPGAVPMVSVVEQTQEGVSN